MWDNKSDLLFFSLIFVELEFGDIKWFVNHFWNRLNFRAQLGFDAMKSEAIVVRDQIDGDTEMSESARSTDTMQVRFGHFRKIEIDDNVDGLNVDTTSEKICLEKEIRR